MIEREMVERFKRLSSTRKVIFISGARQVGK